MCKEIQSTEHKFMSTATVKTAGFVRQLLEIESKGWGDEAQALRRIAREAKVSFWTLNNLRIGRAKTINADVSERVRGYFIDHCRKQAARLLHEAEAAEKTGPGNDALAAVANQIRALAVELEAAKGLEKEEMK